MLKYDPRQAVFSQTVGVLASAGGILLAGWLGDRIPPRYLLRTGVTLLTVFALPFYGALAAHSMNLTLLCVAAGLCAGLTNGSFAVLLTDLFPTRIRFTGVALVFNVSFTLVQRDGAACRHDADRRHRHGGVTRVSDDGQRAARADRQPLGGTAWRKCSGRDSH